MPRPHIKTAFIFFLLAAPLSPPPAGAGSQTSAEQPRVIYGNDDRRDLYEVGDPQLLERADAVALVAARASLDSGCTGSGGQCTITSSAYADYFLPPVCANEPYIDQTTAGFCSAFLIGPNLVATAGHCIDVFSCDTTAFVFGYAKYAATEAPMTEGLDTYFCRCIVDHTLTATGADHAVVLLDRAVEGRTPMPVMDSGPLELNQDLVLMGHPVGLPLKIDDGGEIKQLFSDYFDANVDAYGPSVPLTMRQ